MWIADIPGDNRRPVVVLTRSTFIPRLANVTVAPVVTIVRDIPTELIVGEGHGIDHRSAVSLDNILTLHRRHLLRRVGALSDAELEQVCEALALALGCD
ncbi:MAG: type II toxin-antitoxin system PemK/MazF family toxin [Actinobacteria bacterium]|nr:type II toxin-antitoxin system PemK/MazF family toxin [Actinomycetota bacterium]